MDDMYFYDTLASSGSLTLEEMIENDIKMERVSASDDDTDFNFTTGHSNNNNHTNRHVNHHHNYHHHHHHHHHNNNHHNHNNRPSSGLFGETFASNLHDDSVDFRLDFDGGGGLLVNPRTGLPSGLDPSVDGDDDNNSVGADFPPLITVVKPSSLAERELVASNNVKRKTPPKSAPIIKKKFCDRSRPSFYSCENGWARFPMTSSDSDDSSDEDDEVDDDIDISMKRTSWVNGDGGELDAHRRRTKLLLKREADEEVVADVGCSPRRQVRLPVAVAVDDEDEEEGDDDDDDKFVAATVTAPMSGSNGVGHRNRVFPKPAFSYSCLIAIALKNSSTGCLPVSEIYSFMIETFPYFKTAPNGWKNSVRHNLSLNKCFEKIENNAPTNNGSNQRKGCLWALNPDKALKMDEEVQKWSRKNPISIRNSMARPETFELLGTGLIRRPGEPSLIDDARRVILDPRKATVVQAKAVNNMINSELDILDDDEDDVDDDDVEVDSTSESDCESFGNPELWRALVDKMDLELPINEYLISPERRRDVEATPSGAKFTPPILANSKGIKVSNRIVPAAKRLATSRERVA